ncbi:MAG: ATP-binding protein [Anaerolineae bacterium]
MADKARPQHTTILYVEDDPSSVALVRRVLEGEGHRVVIASDGLSAIEIAKREMPALILMDINIGGLDGHEVTTHLRSIEEMRRVPIVAVTAATLQGDRERALIAGCTGYIPKPIDVDEFPDQVRSFLLRAREEIESPEEKNEYLVEYSRKLVDRLEEKIRELEGAHAELQRIEKVKSDFIILASHELRTPLTCVYGYVQMLLNNPDIPDAPGEEDSPRKLLQRVAHAAQRLDQIFDEIRNVSLIDADRLDLAREPVLLKPLIRGVVERVQGFSPSRNLQFEFEDLEDLPALNGDEKRLHQALWNVISNSVKYTPDGGHIRIVGRQIGDTVHISVQDTGVGIPVEEQERIFDRFYVLEDTARHHSSKTAFKGGGLGLGLTVARGIIEAHGGRIWVESTGYDEERLPGSTFHILLPVCEPSFWLTAASTPEARFPLPGASQDRESSSSG